jgi:uncharacterized DUF497 family protein
VQIAFNPAKDAINLAKHGVSLALAKQFDWGVVYAVIFSRRDDVYWIISLRHASRNERRAL